MKALGRIFIASVVLTVGFTALRTAGIIDWEWVWIISPLWINGLSHQGLLFVTGFLKDSNGGEA